MSLDAWTEVEYDNATSVDHHSIPRTLPAGGDPWPEPVTSRVQDASSKNRTSIASMAASRNQAHQSSDRGSDRTDGGLQQLASVV